MSTAVETRLRLAHYAGRIEGFVEPVLELLRAHLGRLIADQYRALLWEHMGAPTWPEHARRLEARRRDVDAWGPI